MTYRKTEMETGTDLVQNGEGSGWMVFAPTGLEMSSGLCCVLLNFFAHWV